MRTEERHSDYVGLDTPDRRVMYRIGGPLKMKRDTYSELRSCDTRRFFIGRTRFDIGAVGSHRGTGLRVDLSRDGQFEKSGFCGVVADDGRGSAVTLILK